jgi:hypothetical protein
MNLNPEKIFAALGGMLLLAGLAYHQVRDKAPLDADNELLIGTALKQQAEPAEKAMPGTDKVSAVPESEIEECRDGESVHETDQQTEPDCKKNSTSG